jgi:hypothetical protein
LRDGPNPHVRMQQSCTHNVLVSSHVDMALVCRGLSLREYLGISRYIGEPPLLKVYQGICQCISRISNYIYNVYHYLLFQCSRSHPEVVVVYLLLYIEFHLLLYIEFVVVVHRVCCYTPGTALFSGPSINVCARIQLLGQHSSQDHSLSVCTMIQLLGQHSSQDHPLMFVQGYSSWDSTLLRTIHLVFVQ